MLKRRASQFLLAASELHRPLAPASSRLAASPKTLSLREESAPVALLPPLASSASAGGAAAAAAPALRGGCSRSTVLRKRASRARTPSLVLGGRVTGPVRSSDFCTSGEIRPLADAIDGIDFCKDLLTASRICVPSIFSTASDGMSTRVGKARCTLMVSARDKSARARVVGWWRVEGVAV